MQRSRLLILVGLLLLLGTGGVFLAITALGSITATPTPPPPTAIPENVAQIVIAVQPLTRGVRIPQEAVAIAPWPANNLPPSVITDTKQIVGKVPRFNIDRGLPVLQSMVADPTKLDLAGSEIALKIEPGFTGISLPINRLSSMAYGIGEGDRVNILVAMLFVDLDEASQSPLPLKLRLLTQDPVAKTVAQIDAGSFIKSTSDVRIDAFSFFYPSTYNPQRPTDLTQRPRLVVQQIAQDVLVLKMGTFGKATEPAAPAAAAAPAEAATPAPAAAGTPTAPPPATPVPDIITLSVSQQDSLVLNYFMYANAKFTLTLRAAGDNKRVDTESVTLQYAIQRFRISVPTQLPYGLEPGIKTLKAPTLPNDEIKKPELIPLPDGTTLCLGAACP